MDMSNRMKRPAKAMDAEGLDDEVPELHLLDKVDMET